MRGLSAARESLLLVATREEPMQQQTPNATTNK